MKSSAFSKRILRMLLALVLVLGLFDTVYADDEDVYEESSSSTYASSDEDDAGTRECEPQFKLLDGKNLGSYKSGEKQIIDVNLENTGSYHVRNLKLELKVDPKDENLYNRKEFIKKVDRLDTKEERNIQFPFQMIEATPEGTYSMTLHATYENTYGDAYVKDIPVYIYVENTNLQPVVLVAKTTFDSDAVNPDASSKMTLTIKNKGDLAARNIEVKLDNLSPKGVYLVNDAEIRKIQTLGRRDSKDLVFNLRANKDAEKEYELGVSISYYDEVSKKFERTQKILVPCSSSGKSAELSNVKMKFSSSEYSIHGEGKATVKLNLKNNGEKDIKDLKLELSSDPAVIFMSKYIDLIDNLKAGQSKDFTYTVMSADPESKGSHPITAKLTLLSSKEEEDKKSKMEIAGLTCYKKDGASAGKKPKIIIADYKYSGEKIVAGKPFELSITVKNTSQSIGIKNVKMTHSSQDEVFIPIDAANSFFIESLAPNASVEKTIKLTSKPDAAAKMYKMDFKGEYEDETGKSYDEKGNPFESNESIVLNLTQEIRLEIPELKVSEFGTVGEGIPIDTEFYNMGKAPLYNMMVKIEGDFDSDVSNYFVGNFEASRSDMFSCKITPTKAGETKGKLIFEFEDESGNKDSIVKEFTINVEEGMPMDPMMEGEGGMDEFNPDGMDGMDMEEMEFDENGNPIPKSQGLSTMYIIIIVVLVIVALIVLRIVLKKRKKKKLEKLLLEPDDEAK